MRFAAIADVHGNAPALIAVLADIKQLGIETVVNLGDHVGGPLEAAKTADLLMECGLPSIRGNHDRMVVEKAATDLGMSDKSALAQLKPHHLKWLETLPATLVFRDEVFLCHGTPTSDDTYWLEHVTPGGVVRIVDVALIVDARPVEEFGLIDKPQRQVGFGFKLETITKVGYRLTSVPAPAGELNQHDGPAPQSAHQAEPGKPSIAVLAFDGSADDEQEAYFTEALADDLIAGLTYRKDQSAPFVGDQFPQKGRTRRCLGSEGEAETKTRQKQRRARAERCQSHARDYRSGAQARHSQ